MPDGTTTAPKRRGSTGPTGRLTPAENARRAALIERRTAFLAAGGTREDWQAQRAAEIAAEKQARLAEVQRQQAECRAQAAARARALYEQRQADARARATQGPQGRPWTPERRARQMQTLRRKREQSAAGRQAAERIWGPSSPAPRSREA